MQLGRCTPTSSCGDGRLGPSRSGPGRSNPRNLPVPGEGSSLNCGTGPGASPTRQGSNLHFRLSKRWGWQPQWYFDRVSMQGVGKSCQTRDWYEHQTYASPVNTYLKCECFATHAATTAPARMSHQPTVRRYPPPGSYASLWQAGSAPRRHDGRAGAICLRQARMARRVASLADC